MDRPVPLARAHAPGEKRSALIGGAASEEAIASSRSVLSRARGGQITGLQQFYSPPEAAELLASVLRGPRGPYHELPVLDPTAGDGALLAALPAADRFGIEIDPDQVAAGDYTGVCGDLQRIYPLLRLAGIEFPAVALNPPFGLDWRDAEGRRINSTVQAFRCALGLLERGGQGVLIAGRDRFWRELAPRPEAAGVYCVIAVADLFDGVELPCVVAFFVGPKTRGEGEAVRFEAPRSELPGMAEAITGARRALCGHVSSYWRGDRESLRKSLRAVQVEHNRRRQAGRRTARHDVVLRGETLAVNPSAFSQIALAKVGLLTQVRGLDGKHLAYFALALREWRTLERAGSDGLVSIDPAVGARVKAVVAEAERAAVPLYPVRPQQRLGFLEDLERLRCVKDDPEHGFLAGESYPLSTRSQVLVERDTRVVVNRRGEEEARDVERQRKLLEIRVGDQSFDEGTEAIGYLVEHFDMPDPGDLATRFPQEVAEAKRLLEAIAHEHRFRLKGFQLEDLARLVVKGGGVLAWEQGLGKSLGALAFAAAMVRRGAKNRCLFVVPQDLIPQWQREARKFLACSLEVIAGPADALRVRGHLRGGGEGWYITHYEALSRTGARDEALPEAWVLADGEHRFVPRRVRGEDGELVLGEPRRLSSAEFCPACRADHFHGWRGTVCEGCGYVHKRLKVATAASILATAFRGGVGCVDELSMIRGDDSLRSRAIRGMRFAHYLGATGTPISNYVNDAFHGLVWALRPASVRFPYDMEGKAQFERDFCVIEHQMGKEGTEKEGKRVRRKILPEVTNLSVLWRLLSTAIIRRRKEDTGEPLVSRTFRPVRVPFGERQLALHEKWLADFKRFFEQTHPTSPLVKAGIVHLFCAAVGQLPKLEYAATLPEADPDLAWTAVEASNWTPKTLKVLELCLERVRAGDKVLVGSCLVETGRFLAERLRERGVEALHIVEEREGRAQTKAPRKRAAEIAAFYEGEAQVLCCGVQAVKLGHNMDVASSVILTGLPWSHEALDQFLARVHRLTSKRPVSVYVCLTKGSIDDRKWQLLSDKGAAADLALDGQLIEKREERVDWSAILREMQAAGVRATGEELAEEDVEALWRRAEGGLAPIAAPVPARHLRAVPALTGPPPPPAPVIPLHALAALDDPEQLELFAEAA